MTHMAGINQYNETFLGNAPVPTAGTKAGSTERSGYGMDQSAKAVGTHRGVQMFDPAASPKVDRRDMHAERSEPAMGGAKFKPKMVDSFEDGDV